MKHILSIILLAFFVASIVLSQERKPHLLAKPDMSQVWHSVPGVIPANTMKYDPIVDGIIHQVSLDTLISFVRILSGEDSVVVGTTKVLIHNRGSRDTTSPGFPSGTQGAGGLAADYLKQKLASYNLQVFDQVYSVTGRNVYAKQTGYLYPQKEYIICAHYDALAKNSADDNASGVAGVLEAARILSHYDPKYTVVYAFWDEEEEGLVGSGYYASQSSSSQEQIQGVLNMDMIGWDSNNDYLADIHTQNTASSNDIANLLVIVNYLYDLPVKPVIYNPGTWQSDHSSFWNQGFGAVLLIEAYYGGDLNPYYHTDGDSIGNFNLPFFHSMSKLSIGALSTLLQVTTGPVIATVVPDSGYQTYPEDITITGVNTHFQQNAGATRVWLSQKSDTLKADSILIRSNTALDAYFRFPLTANPGSWDVNVQTSADSILTDLGGFSIFAPPPIISASIDSLTISVLPGGSAQRALTLRNDGPSNLYFRIIGGSNHAVQFDGVTGMVTAPTKGLPVGNSDRTMELWFWRNAQVTNEGTLVGYGTWGQWDGTYELVIGGNTLTFTQWGNGVNSRTVIQSGQWYHAAVVNQGDDAILYLNGQVEQSGTLGITTPSGTSFLMGKAPSGYDSDKRFNGAIDEVRIWNYARTQAQILSDMHHQLLGTEPRLVGYWPFDEGGGSTAYDKTANHNNGTLQGGVTWVSSTAPIMPPWLSVSCDSGTCAAHSSLNLNLQFDATTLDTGDYCARLTIRHNDPFHPAIVIPVDMKVSSTVRVGPDAIIPKVFDLSQNYPNPFNPTTTIKYQLPLTTNVSLKVFDLLGREVATLVNGRKTAGFYTVNWDASQLSSGVYFYRLEAGTFVETKKLMLMK